jgi:hypothetical protein
LTTFSLCGYLPSRFDDYCGCQKRFAFVPVELNTLNDSRREEQSMKLLRKPFLWAAVWTMTTAPALPAAMLWAQNLGAAPATNVAVQGETAAQPEGTFLNFINWVGNVIAPVSAGGAIVGAVAAWLTGRGVGRWLVATAALLLVSGVTRLIEFFVTNGTGGVT